MKPTKLFLCSKGRMAFSAGALSLGLATASLAADAPLKQLTGHVPAAVRQLNPKGSPPATNRMNLAIGVTPRDSVGLSNFLANLYDPFNPQYHHYLTPDQFAEQFGPSNADYAAVISFAESHNLPVTAIHANRLVLDVSGAVQDVKRTCASRCRPTAIPPSRGIFTRQVPTLRWMLPFRWRTCPV